MRWLDQHLDYLASEHVVSPAAVLEASNEPFVGPPSTVSNQPPPKGFDQMLAVARSFDVAGRDQRNRALGRAGEERVLAHEKAALIAGGRSDLAKRVKWEAAEEEDGADYDIASFSPEGCIRLIKVKTTNAWERAQFHITRDDLAFADERPDEWRLLQLWNFARQPRAFEVPPPLDAHVNLIATNYEARFL